MSPVLPMTAAPSENPTVVPTHTPTQMTSTPTVSPTQATASPSMNAAQVTRVYASMVKKETIQKEIVRDETELFSATVLTAGTCAWKLGDVSRNANSHSNPSPCLVYRSQWVPQR
jgi:hypothetical protein